jgi:hypothetical protein
LYDSLQHALVRGRGQWVCEDWKVKEEAVQAGKFGGGRTWPGRAPTAGVERPTMCERDIGANQYNSLRIIPYRRLLVSLSC